MRLLSLQVEGGFLDGLNVDFQPDLNVLIGGRGVGKTALVEIIRYCLGAPNLDAELASESFDHAVGVLQDGLATLNVEIEGVQRAFSRSASDREFKGLEKSVPLILSQREVETLARTPKGRLSLLDSFFVAPIDSRRSVGAAIRALSVEIRDLCGELDELESQLDRREETKSQLEALKASQVAMGALSVARNAKLEKVDELHQELRQIALGEDALSKAREQIRRWLEALPANYDVAATLPTWPLSGDPLSEMRLALAGDFQVVQGLVNKARQHLQYVDVLRHNAQVARAPLDEELRQLRVELEAEQAGSGQLAREIGRLEEALVRFDSLEQTMSVKRARVVNAQQRRLEMVSQLSAYREAIFERRRKAAESLSQSLSPKIKVDVQHLTDVRAYERAIQECLRGSNLRYAELAPIIAREISPAELCEIAFNRSVGTLSRLLNISEDRSSRLILALRDSKIEEILTADLEDSVEFCLLDGMTYKRIEELSIGQRCTVVLSIVLENVNVVLVVDQPEDHLDNEFVAETLIKAISNRSVFAQTIVSTHNANIPVLGDASQVIQLDSNGQRGFVKCSGGLTDPAVVDAVLSVMEGGESAFSRRAHFYENIL